MNDPAFAIDRIDEIICDAQNCQRPQQLAAYAAAMTIIREFEEYLNEQQPSGFLYLLEKCGSARWHIGAMFGLDVDNGHSTSQHYCWAIGDLQILRHNLTRSALRRTA